MKLRIDKQRIKDATNALKIGGTYFLSSFYDKEGAMVKVLEATTKTNRAGWPSSVKVEVLEVITDRPNASYQFYKIGDIHTVNATNLYTKREDASHTAKWKGKDIEKTVRALLGAPAKRPG